MFAFLLLVFSNPAAVVLLIVGSFIAALLAGGLHKTPPNRSKPSARKVTAPPRISSLAPVQDATPAQKRGPGRPRKNPIPDPDAPKRPRGRPRKTPAPAPAAPVHRADMAGAVSGWSVQLAQRIDDHPITSGTWFTLTRKLNGVRGTFYRGSIIGRNGVHYCGLEHIEKALSPYMDYVFDGELTLRDPGTLTDSEAFQAAAGLIRRRESDKPNISLTVFDVIPVSEFDAGESSETYAQRRRQLDMMAAELNATGSVRVLPVLYQGADAAVIAPLLRKVTDAGCEGLIANTDTTYQRRRHAGILKIKLFHTMDLPIVRCEEGTGKLAGTLGALIVDFHGAEVGVGTGFTKTQRADLWRRRDELAGTLAEVKYKEVTTNATGGKSLQFPVFMDLREDKREASYGPDAPDRLYEVLDGTDEADAMTPEEFIKSLSA